MKISLIAAMCDNRIIGKDNTMPWHLPADFAWFKKQTLNKPVIMGRKTLLSIGRALPERRNIVLTQDRQFSFDGVDVVNSIDAALELVADQPEIMVIGGGTLYQALLPKSHRLYLTLIDASLEGDTSFPDWGTDWQIISESQHQADEKNAYGMRFLIMERA